MRVLGIETSCDETAAAVVTAARDILANRVLSQNDAHAEFGGIVPEIAARAHLEHLDGLVAGALDDAGCTLADLDAIAATAGPGLIGGVLVGATFAKGLACVTEKPFIAVNHLEGHALTARLSHGTAFPYLLLLISGGHCQTLVVLGVGRYRRLGTTLDDAAGEAFDKVAKILGLGYPGGPAVERAAKAGDATRFTLPRPMRGHASCHFSFSGLKTRVRQAVDGLGAPPTAEDAADLSAAFQKAVAETLAERCTRAIESARAETPNLTALVVAGGVAANSAVRAALEAVADKAGLPFIAPPAALCTDNAAMIAWAGVERLQLGLTDALDFRPRPRWPLDPDAPAAAYAGVKA